MNFPVITLEIQGMKHAVKTALMEHMVKQSEEVQAAIDRICTIENIVRIVNETASREIEAAIKSEIQSFYSYGAGRQAVRDAVAKALDERSQRSN